MLTMIRYVPWVGFRTFFRVTRQSTVSASSSPSAIGLNLSNSETIDKITEESRTSELDQKSELTIKKYKPLTKNSKDIKNKSIVAAAFASLKHEETNELHSNHPSTLEEKIKSAGSVAVLLNLAENVNISRRHALRIVSILADWTSVNRIKLTDFESDPRFVKICRLLGRGITRNAKDSMHESAGFGDLAMVLGVTGDDEAAKLVAGISLNQMIRVMSTLAMKRKRSTPLLRSLAFNIGRSDELLDIKQGADVLYAMAILNFPDESLLERTCSNLCLVIDTNQKSSVTGSILVSVGLLRFKHTELLDGISEWVVKNWEICRPKDLVALLLTLASVDHLPANADQLFEKVVLKVTSNDLPNAVAWLDLVWALVVLGKVTPTHLESVLSDQFLEKLELSSPDVGSLNVASKLKLLNINAYAQLLVPHYKGPVLANESAVHKIPIKRSREKNILVAAVLDSLSNLLPSATYLRTDVDTGMGFLLDGECVVDAKCTPLPVSEPVDNTKASRVCILCWDYSDMCRGMRLQPCGTASLAVRLLEAKGYKVLAVPYTEFNPREKLVTRVQYLEQQLKMLARKR